MPRRLPSSWATARITLALEAAPTLHHRKSTPKRCGCRVHLMPDKTRVIGHDDFPPVIPCTRGTQGAHEHLRGEDKHIKLRAIAVDRPRAILVLSVGRAGPGRSR